MRADNILLRFAIAYDCSMRFGWKGLLKMHGVTEKILKEQPACKWEYCFSSNHSFIAPAITIHFLCYYIINFLVRFRLQDTQSHGGH